MPRIHARRMRHTGHVTPCAMRQKFKPCQWPHLDIDLLVSMLVVFVEGSPVSNDYDVGVDLLKATPKPK